MSIYDEVKTQDHRERYYAAEAVKLYQAGDRDMALWYMARAATARHLAYEWRELWTLTSDNMAEHLRELIARRTT